MTPSSNAATTSIPEPMRLALRQAALQRNLRTAAVLGVASSGALLGLSGLAATTGATFVVLLGWRLVQLRQPQMQRSADKPAPRTKTGW